MNITFFESPDQFRRWLEQHHAQAQELWVGFYKKGSGKPSITWPEAVDQALCYGWIDGVRKSRDESSYIIRFTPRKPNSIWSTVNIKRVEELSRLGLMQPAGLKAFQVRKEQRSSVYAYEQKDHKLDPEYEKKLRANKKAWTFFSTQAPSYQRTVTWWVMSAKKEETRLKRLARLIKDSAQGRRVGLFARAPRSE